MAKNQPEVPFGEIGERLELIRLVYGIDNKVIAKAAGVSEQLWGHYKMGRHCISVDAAVRLCITYGVDLDFIYRGIRGEGLSPLFREKLAAYEAPQKRSRRA